MDQRLIVPLCGLCLLCLAAQKPGDDQWHPSLCIPVCIADGDQQSPAISLSDAGLLVVWQDSRPDGKNPKTKYPWSVYGRYLKRAKAFPIHVPPDSNAMHPDVSGNNVVWQNHRGWNNLLLTTLTNQKPADIKRIEGYASSAPAIDGNLIVWASSKNRYEAGKGQIGWITDIRAFELDGPGIAFDVTNDKRVPQLSPSICGKVVVWHYRRSGNSSYDSAFADYRNIDTNPQPFRAAGIRTKKATNCSISDRVIVWQDNRNGNWDIYGLDIKSRKQRVICLSPGDQTNPVVHGSWVVWQDNRNGNWDIYGYDLDAQSVVPVFVADGNQTEPAIYGDTVVWTDDRNGEKNIYMNQRRKKSHNQDRD